MTEIKYDCIIIGGGISGVSFAHYLHTIGKKVLILEQKDRVGGQIQTLFSVQNPDYWRELGSHTCYNSYTHLLSIVKDIKRTDLIKRLGKGSYKIHTEGKVKKMSSEMSFLPMMINCPKMFTVTKNGKTVKEYFRKIVGASNYDRLFSRLFRAVICQTADDYPAELFLKRRSGRYKEFPHKYTFENGISSLIEAIVKEDKLEVHTGIKVTGIERVADGDKFYYKVKTENGDCFLSRSLGLASDPRTTSSLLKGVNSPLADILASIPLFASESFNVIVPKEKLSLDVVAGIIPVSDDFMSVVSRDLIDDPKLRSFTFHFEKGKADDKRKKELACNVLGITDEDIPESTQISHILPAMKLEHLNMAERIDEYRTEDDLFILGNYFYGLSLEDCVHRSSDEFGRYRQLAVR